MLGSFLRKSLKYTDIHGGFVHAIRQDTVITSVFFFAMVLQNTVNISILGCSVHQTL